MLDNFTIVMPTHNRHRQLARGLDYYARSGIKIIVGDSSPIPFADKDKYPNLQYFHYPNKTFAQKMCLLFKKVNTKYVAYCGDDDFLIPSGIEASIEFLEKNPDYVSAHGHYARFIENDKGKITISLACLSTLKTFVDSPLPWERMDQVLSNYMQLYYATLRTTNAKKVYRLLEKNPDLTNDSLLELFLTILLSIDGKSKILPLLYALRETTPNSAGIYVDSLEVINVSPQYKKEHQLWLKLIVKYLLSKEKLTPQQAKAKVELSLSHYLKPLQLNISDHKFNLAKFKTRTNNLFLGVPAKITNYIRFRSVTKKHTFYQKSSQKEYLLIKKYIKKYPKKDLDKSTLLR